MLLADLALIPDVFAPSFYDSPTVRDICLNQLKQILLEGALFRDLRESKWKKYISDPERMRTWGGLPQKIIETILKRNLCYQVPAQRTKDPVSDEEWCCEAIESHTRLSLKTGILATKKTAAAFHSALISPIEDLGSLSWWAEFCGKTIKPIKKTADYLAQLELFFKHANSLMFIDPHINPWNRDYEEFPKLLMACQRRTPLPRIEIHTNCQIGEGGKRTVYENSEYEKEFRSWFKDLPNHEHVKIVLWDKNRVWDDFHARFLITNICSVQLDHGFYVSNRKEEQTIWHRLSRSDSDFFQKAFDISSNFKGVYHSFDI